jgi:hypothetical protein
MKDAVLSKSLKPCLWKDNYLQPHFGHLIGSCALVIFLPILTLLIVISSDSKGQLRLSHFQ